MTRRNKPTALRVLPPRSRGGRSRKNLLFVRYGDPYRTQVSPGEYRVHYVGYDEGIAYGQKRIFCWFIISSDQESASRPLLRFYNPIRGKFVP